MDVARKIEMETAVDRLKEHLKDLEKKRLIDVAEERWKRDRQSEREKLQHRPGRR